MPSVAAIVFALLALAVPWSAGAQTSGPPAKIDGADEGIAVRSDLVRAKCGSCHATDARQRMSRISYRRATPENWERTIKRMVTLNKVSLDPGDARSILKYLADHQGLAPGGERPIGFEAGRRWFGYSYAGDTAAAY